MKLTRRGVLTGAAIGGGVLVAWNLMPRSYDAPLSPGQGEFAFDAWLKIASDGVVTVAMPQLEMGQGVSTLLPQIVALELGADWRQIAVEPAPVSGAYVNLPLAAHWAPLWRPLVPELANAPDDYLLERWAQASSFTATAAGTTLAAFEQSAREAGASARAMLAMAAADQWDIDWEECEAASGFIEHEDKRASFAELAMAASRFDPPDPAPLRPEPPQQRSPQIEGLEAELAFPRLDLPSKVDGSHIFAGDVRLPGMLFAAIRHGPHLGAEPGALDETRIAGQPGLVQLVRGRDWVAALGETWWAAEQALQRLAPPFGAERPVKSSTIASRLDEAVRSGDTFRIAELGEGLSEDYAPDFARRYDIAPALHATLETTSATARLADGLLELWLPSQAPEAARAAAAKALGMAPSEAVLYPVAAGGSFDRRLDHRIAIQVALLAREAGRPVQLTWSRMEEHTASYPRAPAACLMGAVLGSEGAIQQLRMRIASPPFMREFGHRLFDNHTAASAIEAASGAQDAMAVSGGLISYAFRRATLEHVPVSLDLPTGPMRGQADGMTCFMRECFLDEIAAEHQREPMSYRIAMLGKDVALATCLQEAARLAQWDGGRPGTSQGIACHRMNLGRASGRIALVAQAGAGEGGIQVARLSACVNIGRVVNRDIALQQIEGGLLYGMALALGSSTDYADGRPTNERLQALALPRLATVPAIEITLLDSDDPPFDPGEIGVPPVAPAIANAYFSATGRRLRRLPLLSAG